mgnify:CR=1 FL=1
MQHRAQERDHHGFIRNELGDDEADSAAENTSGESAAAGESLVSLLQRANGGSADFAKRVELHKSIQEGDSVRMVPMGAVELAPGESLKLMPGGAHIMLMGISDMPTAESTVSLCLTTQEGANCTTAQVLRKGPQSDHDAHHLHMNH